MGFQSPCAGYTSTGTNPIVKSRATVAYPDVHSDGHQPRRPDDSGRVISIVEVGAVTLRQILSFR